MRAIIASTFALAVAPAAFAWGPPLSGLEIDNDTGRQVEVYIDGSFSGSLRHGDERTFSARPGNHRVRVVQTGGLEVYDRTVNLSPSRITHVNVLPPRATLRLDNDGDAPLLVAVAGFEGVWLLPNSKTSLTVPSGAVQVTTSMYTPQGLQLVGQFDFSLTPGRTTERDIGWHAPPPTSRITVTNRENNTLRIYVSGREIAVLPVGATRTFDVRGGRQMVTVVEHGGRIVYNEAVTFDPRNDHRVVISGGRGVRDIGNRGRVGQSERPSHGGRYAYN